MENGNGLTKADLKAALTELKQEIVAELTEQISQVQTRPPAEFSGHGKGQQIRLTSLESFDAGLVERLAFIEERLLHIESRRPPTI